MDSHEGEIPHAFTVPLRTAMKYGVGVCEAMRGHDVHSHGAVELVEPVGETWTEITEKGLAGGSGDVAEGVRLIAHRGGVAN